MIVTLPGHSTLHFSLSLNGSVVDQIFCPTIPALLTPSTSIGTIRKRTVSLMILFAETGMELTFEFVDSAGLSLSLFQFPLSFNLLAHHLIH